MRRVLMFIGAVVLLLGLAPAAGANGCHHHHHCHRPASTTTTVTIPPTTIPPTTIPPTTQPAETSSTTISDRPTATIEEGEPEHKPPPESAPGAPVEATPTFTG